MIQEQTASLHSVLQIGKFYPPHSGGIESHLQALVRGLSSRFMIDVLVANDGYGRSEDQLDGAKIVRLPTFGSLASMPLVPSLGWELKQYTPEIIHIHTPNPGASFALRHSFRKVPIVVTHHADILGREKLHRLVRPFNRQLMSRAHRIIVTSQRYMKTSPELTEYLDKCVVIPLGIGEGAFDIPNPSEVHRVISQFGERLVLAVGRLVPYKGFEHLIKAMSAVDGTLLIVGTGPLQAKLRDVVSSLGLTSKVRFAGTVDRLPPYYYAAKVLAMPSVSRAEAFGMVQLEAMAAGLPIVNTDIDSAVPEVSMNEVTGLTVPPADSRALAHAVNFLLDHEDQRKRMGNAARERAHAEYSEERMLRRTLDLYEQILQEAQSGIERATSFSSLPYSGISARRMQQPVTSCSRLPDGPYK